MAMNLLVNTARCTFMAKETKKCKHPACRCKAREDDDYCSEFCKGAGDMTELTCECGHPACAPL